MHIAAPIGLIEPPTRSRRAPGAVRRAGGGLARAARVARMSSSNTRSPIPRALPASPSLSQMVDVVNENSAKVQSLSAPRATMTMPGLPSLNANIAFVRPRSFRLVAQKFLGPEFDLGSNDELLWFWVRTRSRRRCISAATTSSPPAPPDRSCRWSPNG